SPESHAEYRRIIGEWTALHRPPPKADDPAPNPSVNDVLLAYWRHAQGNYVKDGAPTREQDTIRQALRFIRRLYGGTRAKDFGPLALKAVRQAMVAHKIVRKVRVRDPETGAESVEERVMGEGLARSFINKQVNRMRLAFRWAAENELVPVAVYQALQAVAGL